MRRFPKFLSLAVVLLTVPCSAVFGQEGGEAPEVTLELIMSNPDWLGRAPARPYWADDGRSVYYFRKREGEDRRDLVQVDLAGKVLRIASDKDRGTTDVGSGDFSADRSLKVYARSGDIYLKDIRSGQIRQLTRTAEAESNPRFLIGDERISFTRSRTVLVRHLDSGLEEQPADLRAEKDPAEKKKGNYLSQQQERLFEIVRQSASKRDKAREVERTERSSDPSRVDEAWYLGADVSILSRVLSPSGKWMAVRLTKKKRDRGKSDSMPNYVTDTGYVVSRDVRPKVGTGKPATERLVLLDLESRSLHEIERSKFSGIEEDPLAFLLKKTDPQSGLGSGSGAVEPVPSPDKQSDSRGAEKKSQVRAGRFSTVTWSDDGRYLAFQFFSWDNKDRWIGVFDVDSAQLSELERMSDEAWINRRLVRLGWVPDGHSLFFTTERTGYAHLSVRDVGAKESRALTSGSYEVSRVSVSNDGGHFYLTANVDHPGVYEFYRLPVSGGQLEKLTDLGGRNVALLSPDESRLLISHSETARPSELFVQDARPGAPPRRLTETTSEKFLSIEWNRPEIVAIPSSHSDQPIYSRVYNPTGSDTGTRRPAVMFVHGAGYLQNSHKGWSGYFREFMFHTLLTRHGYVVIDMDYRASAGYGRDWRTAIYRRMGTPELEDFQDGVKWLVENRNVDPDRIGVYGGSYGGFMTLMALFREPDLFACGASLRPVTDWAHYNHPYTSNILNTPDSDPEAYARSSPIEFANGLTKPLLICHGMQDDNVFFQDTVRLAQRLIELKKENWEVALFPIEPHGFREPTSWLDEYRRIFKLFETHLK